MIHKLRKADGIRFLTKGTICRDDITVVPELQTLEIDKRGIYTADEGYVGIGEINVNIPEVTTEEAEVTPNTDTQYVTPKGADYLSKVTVKPIPSTYVPEGYVPRPVFQEKTVTDYSAEVTPDKGFDGLSKVIVAVPEPVLKSKTITGNGTYNAADDGADGYSSITVDVPNSGGGAVAGSYKFVSSITDRGAVEINVDVKPTDHFDYIEAIYDGQRVYMLPALMSNSYMTVFAVLGAFELGETFSDTEWGEIYQNIGDVPDSLTGKTMDIISTGQFAEWLLANAFPVNGGGEIKLYKFNDTISHTGMKEVEVGEINAILETIDPIIVKVSEDGQSALVGVYPIFLYDSIIKKTYLYNVYAQVGSSEPMRVYYSDDTDTVSELNTFGEFELISKGEFSEWFNANTTPVDSGGECDKPHVIEVEELPTENIDKNAVYKCGDSFYQTTKSFEDVIIVAETGESVPFKDFALLQGITFSLNTIPTKTTDGIMVSDLMGANFHIYYIEDEDNVFMFISNEWESLESFWDGAMFGPYNGPIHDASEATVVGHYLLLFDGWGEYLMPSEDLIIESSEHAKIDVTKVKNLYINIPDVSASVVGAWRFNESLDITSNVSGEYLNINFTSGRGYSYIGFDFSLYTDGSYGGATLVYKYSDTSGSVVYRHDDGWSIGYRVIDFGTEPQNIPAVIKEWLVANATPIYEIKAVGSVIFAIGGTTYFADEGMTWGEWLESDYHEANTFPILENNVGPTLWDSSYGRMSYNGKDVVETDEIIVGATYTYYMP